jgi:hypothetical protein
LAEQVWLLFFSTVFLFSILFQEKIESEGDGLGEVRPPMEKHVTLFLSNDSLAVQMTVCGLRVNHV